MCAQSCGTSYALEFGGRKIRRKTSMKNNTHTYTHTGTHKLRHTNELGGLFSPHCVFSSAEMPPGSWKQTHIQSCWRFISAVMLSTASARKDAHTPPKLGTTFGLWVITVHQVFNSGSELLEESFNRTPACSKTLTFISMLASESPPGPTEWSNTHQTRPG